MRKTILSIFSIILFGTLQAQTVSVEDAKIAAQNYITAVEPSHDVSQMTLYQTFADKYGNNVIYLFNIGDSGFVAFGADRMYDPLIGYSFSGNYDSTYAAPNLKSWLNGFVDDVAAVRSVKNKDNDMLKYHKKCLQKWEDLLSGNTSRLKAKSAKGVESLLVTKWDQGVGYNNYCPSYSYGPGGHSHTGCVATAMAQIIRYHEYPTTGFSRSSYYHGYHGYQYAAYDSVVFDFQKMPRKVNYSSPQEYQHNVSLLCYYCGVSVKMNYLNPNHTTGSGAQSTEVPNGFKYFGYTNSFHMNKLANNAVWDSLLRNDLDNRCPVYYSGVNDEGGHAFVIEGYREDGTYQFNFGWSGSGDGFFTISYAGGFSTQQSAVFNIVPSYFGPLGDTIYVASDGQGGGSSWADANPNLQDAIRLASLYSGKNIWVKNGVYYGNPSSPYSFEMASGVTIRGGFDGTETSLEDRTRNGESVMSGEGSRIAFFSPQTVSNASVYDMTFSDGYAADGSGATIMNGVRIENCTVKNNTSTEGAALLVYHNNIYNSFIYNNQGGGVHMVNGSSLRNSLVAHNDGNGVAVEASKVNGCDIVCNSGTGLVINIDNEDDNSDELSIRNSVIWNNGIQLSSDDISKISFCAIEGLGDLDSNSNFGLTHENRPAEGKGPYFMNPSTTVGPTETLGDWHISSLSPLVDAGDTIRSGTYIRDLDNDSRFRNGRADIGCYEWIPGNSVINATTNNVVIYPNPATSYITVSGADGKAEIYDIMGRKVLTTNLNNTDNTIDISSLPQGLYLIKTETYTKKFYKF